METVTLYESGSTDGYTFCGHRRYFLTKEEAKKDIEGCSMGATDSVEVTIEEGNYYLKGYLKINYEDRDNPLYVRGRKILLALPREIEELVKVQALAKLTEIERFLLGL